MQEKLFAIVNFRTKANGSYKWIKRGQRYWRVLLVRDPQGSTHYSSRNVREVLASSPEGIDGVTARSNYCLDTWRNDLTEMARKFNAGEEI